MRTEKLYQMPFASVYPHYVKKAETKGRTKEELDTVICWLTGYTKAAFQKHLDKKTSMEDFYGKASKYNPNAALITGVVCGVRVENIEDPIMKKIRQMDKIIDELAKGKPMEKILRK